MRMVKTILEILNTSSVQRENPSQTNLFFVILTLSPTHNYGVGVLPQKSWYKFLKTLSSFFYKFASTGVILIDEWTVLL